MINELNDKILEKLQWIDLLQNTYDYFVIQNEGFPYASFELAEFDWEFLDSCENKRFWTFKVAIFQELSKLGRENAKQSLYNILEKIIETFDKDSQLWWLAINTEVVKGQLWNYTSDKWWKMLFLDLNIRVETTLFIK